MAHHGAIFFFLDVTATHRNSLQLAAPHGSFGSLWGHILLCIYMLFKPKKLNRKSSCCAGGQNGERDDTHFEDSRQRRCDHWQVVTATHCDIVQHAGTDFNTLTATHCNTLQHTSTHCTTLKYIAAHCIILQHAAICCSTLPRTRHTCSSFLCGGIAQFGQAYIHTRPQTLQHTLQHTATHWYTLKHTAILRSTQCTSWGGTYSHTATNTATHIATHSNTIQHTDTHWNKLKHSTTHDEQVGKAQIHTRPRTCCNTPLDIPCNTHYNTLTL